MNVTQLKANLIPIKVPTQLHSTREAQGACSLDLKVRVMPAFALNALLHTIPFHEQLQHSPLESPKF